MQGVPLPGFGAGALTRELEDWKDGRHRKVESDSLGSLMNELQYPGGTVCLLHTVELGGRFIARGRVYGKCWTRRQVFLISEGVVSAGENRSYTRCFLHILSISTYRPEETWLPPLSLSQEGFATPMGLKHWGLGLSVLLSIIHVHSGLYSLLTGNYWSPFMMIFSHCLLLSSPLSLMALFLSDPVENKL